MSRGKYGCVANDRTYSAQSGNTGKCGACRLRPLAHVLADSGGCHARRVAPLFFHVGVIPSVKIITENMNEANGFCCVPSTPSFCMCHCLPSPLNSHGLDIRRLLGSLAICYLLLVTPTCREEPPVQAGLEVHTVALGGSETNLQEQASTVQVSPDSLLP